MRGCEDTSPNICGSIRGDQSNTQMLEISYILDRVGARTRFNCSILWHVRPAGYAVDWGFCFELVRHLAQVICTGSRCLNMTQANNHEQNPLPLPDRKNISLKMI